MRRSSSANDALRLRVLAASLRELARRHAEAAAERRGEVARARVARRRACLGGRQPARAAARRRGRGGVRRGSGAAARRPARACAVCASTRESRLGTRSTTRSLPRRDRDARRGRARSARGRRRNRGRARCSPSSNARDREGPAPNCRPRRSSAPARPGRGRRRRRRRGAPARTAASRRARLLELARRRDRPPAPRLVPGDGDVHEPLVEVALLRRPPRARRARAPRAPRRSGRRGCARGLPCTRQPSRSKLRGVATILLCGVDLFFRGKLEALLPEHHFITVDHTDAPDLVIVDISRVDAAGGRRHVPGRPDPRLHEPHRHGRPAGRARRRLRPGGREIGARRARPRARRGADALGLSASLGLPA